MTDIQESGIFWGSFLQFVYYTPRNAVATGIMFVTRPSVRPAVRHSIISFPDYFSKRL